MQIKKHFLLVLLPLAMACNTKQETVDYTKLTDDQLRVVADSLAHAYIITDGHVDLPYRLKEDHFVPSQENMSIIVSTDKGDFDFDRARKGGLDAPFMSIYIPSSYNKTEDFGKSLADSLIDLVNGIAAGLPDKFSVAVTPQEVEANFAAGKISLPMGMENGGPIGTDLANVKYFYDRGIRYITLTHSRDNQISDSSYDTLDTWNGLSPFGEQVVREMNKVGIMVDVSHISDSAFYDVMKITKAPVIASHSSARYFRPGFERDMSDDMIKMLKTNGGVIQINFGSSFLDSAVYQQNDANDKRLREILSGQNLKMSDSLAAPIIEEFRKENPKAYSDVEKVADHIDRVVSLAGIDHVGLGSDFDGVGDSLPTGLKDVSQYPNLIFVLLKRGYSPEDIEKVCSKNVFRVWNEVQKVAQQN